MTSTQPTNPASITNVAALANVSIATVSRVLSGKRDKDDDIARRVRAAAAELNYCVNHAASTLRSDVTNTIGLVIPSSTNRLSAQLLGELEPTLCAHGRRLALGIGNTVQEQAARIEALAAQGLDGLIVVPANASDLPASLERLAERIPIVQVGGQQSSYRTFMIAIDDTAAMETTMRHLADADVRSVAYLAGDRISFDSAELFAMFHTQIRAFGMFTKSSWNQFGDRTVQRGFRCAMQLFGITADLPKRGLAHMRPQALVCCDDAVAIGAMTAIESLGLAVPDDVRVVGDGDSLMALSTTPTLTSLRAPVHRIVTESLRLIDSGTTDPVRIVLPKQLVIRDSTAGDQSLDRA